MANPAIQSLIDSIGSRPTGTLNAPLEEVDIGSIPSIPYEREAAREAASTVAQEQADRLKLLIDAGQDEKGQPFIHRYYESQMGKGWLGGVGSLAERATRKDLIPPEVEALLGEDYIKKLIKVLGASEFTTPEAESTFVEALLTKTIGRGGVEPSEAAKTAAARGGAEGYLDRLIAEWGGRKPTQAEIEGAAPVGADPAVKELLKQYKYSPATDVVAQDVELRYYGRVPLKDPEKFKETTARANAAIRWMSELPLGVDEKGNKVSVAEDIVGKFLVADINSRYGTSDKQYTLQDLDLKLEDTASGKKLTFLHPDPEVRRQPIDPVTFEWGDVIDQMPMLAVIAADVTGSIAGGVLGTKVAGPAGTFLGATGGGALGAGIAKWFTQKRALDMGGFTYDGSKNAYIGKNAAGKNISIPAMDIFMSPVNEAMWSAGGATLGSVIFKMARSLFTRGASEAAHFVNEKDFLEAYKRYGESKWGRELDAGGIKAPPSVQMEAGARTIRQEAEALPVGSKEAKQLFSRAIRLENDATGLRAFESSALPKAGEARQEILEGLIGKTKEGVPRAYFESPEEFGKIVEKALQDGTGTQIKTLLGQMNAANAKLADDWRNLFKEVDEAGDPRAFGESVRTLSAKILGTDTADAGTTKTGLYGTLNALHLAGKRYNRSAWDLTKVARGVEKEIGSLKRVGGQAYPPAIMSYFSKIDIGSKSVSIDQLKYLNDLIEKEMKSAVGSGQRRLYRLSEKLRVVEGRGFKNLDPDLYKQWSEAQKQLKEFKTGFLSQSMGQLADKNLDQVAEGLFSGLRDEKIILSTLGDLARQGAYGKEQTKLLQNILKAKYRQSVTKALPDDAGVSIAGQPRTISVGGQRFQTDTLEAAGHQAFLDQYGPWVKTLFPDDPGFDNFADVVARSSGLKGRYAKIANIEKELKELPWLRDQKIDDLSRIAIEEPYKLFDLAFRDELPSRAIKQLNRVLKKGLEPEEYAVAQGRMKALALRRVWNPTDEFAATKTGGFSLPQLTDESLGVLEREKDAYIEIFGKSHYDNLRELFPLMKAIDSPPDRTGAGSIMRELGKKAERGWARLAFLPIKVWVGVLNRKARALNMGSKWVGAGTESRFEHLLTDADALARVLKMRSNVTGKLAVNALGSTLAISDDEAQNLIDTYTIRDAQGNIIPVPVMSPEEGRSEAIQGIMSQ